MESAKEILARKLKALAESLTSKDKNMAEAKIPISRPTLYKYLAGNVAKIETGQKVLEFFTKIINERLSELKKISIK